MSLALNLTIHEVMDMAHRSPLHDSTSVPNEVDVPDYEAVHPIARRNLFLDGPPSSAGNAP